MASELDPVAGGPTAVAGFQVAGPPANPCLCRVPHGTLHHGILYRILRRDDDTAENQEDQGREKDDERSNTADRYNYCVINITYIIFFPTCVTGFHSCNYRYRSLLLLFHLNEFAFGSLWLKIRGILLEGEVTCVFKIY